MKKPKLVLDIMNHDAKRGTFAELAYRSLLSDKAMFLESLVLRLDLRCDDGDIEIWVGIAADRRVHELDIGGLSGQRLIRLPRSLYTCETLVVLKLRNASLVYFPLVASLRSLKTLHLLFVNYSDDESVPRLLSCCPVLEDLVIKRSPDDNVKTLVVKSSSLQRLSIVQSRESCTGMNVHRIAIDAPSLKYLSIKNSSSGFCLIETTPEMVEANVEVDYSQTNKLLESLTSAKRLVLRLCTFKMPDPYPTGGTFHGLVSLELYIYDASWSMLLAHMLEGSPKLRVLKLIGPPTLLTRDPNVSWNHRPSSVPECLLLHLDKFEWRTYEGTQVEKDVATYILTNAARLNVATISFRATKLEDQLRMVKELASVPRGSAACRLAVD